MNNSISKKEYPQGKDFIFTIFDDTDVATVEYIKPIYDFLTHLGLVTTKTVWPLSCSEKTPYDGSHTLEDEKYAQYIQELSQRGYEIGYHGASMCTNKRDQIIYSFEKYYEIFGHYPRIYAPHSRNRDNLYWGTSRFSYAILRKFYRIITQESYSYYQGHVENTPYFWGDISRQNIDYVRNFTFNDINLLNISQTMSYINKETKWVNKWFFTSDADNVEDFNNLVNLDNQERLQRQRGVCIVSTHFGKGFIKNGEVNALTQHLLKKMSQRNGWFAPVSDVLDFMAKDKRDDVIGGTQLLSLELKWLIHALSRKGKTRNYEQTEDQYLKKQDAI